MTGTSIYPPILVYCAIAAGDYVSDLESVADPLALDTHTNSFDSDETVCSELEAEMDARRPGPEPSTRNFLLDNPFGEDSPTSYSPVENFTQEFFPN